VYTAAANKNVAAQWDVILEHTNPETDSGLVEIQLQKPGKRLLEDVPRSMKLVAPAMVEVFRSLTTAKAPWPLYLFGPAGTGKTRACLALSDYVKGSRYLTVREACDAKMSDGDEAWKGDWASNPTLVVLDELGVRLKVGDLEYSVVTEIFDCRERHGKGVAIYVSNLAPKDLAKLYDDRIASRVLSGTVFKLDGKDRRQKR
jgi:DNA replication protein DnaC